MLKRLTDRTFGDLAIEVVLIILGITCALWFDGMKDSRSERQLEESLLREMVHTLESDTADFRITVEGLERTASAVDTLLLYLDNRRSYHQGLDFYFAAASAGYGFFPNVAAYESLRSAGLQVIRSDSLRQQIVRYYDFQVPAERIIEDLRAFPYRVSVLVPQLTRTLEFEGTRATRFTARPTNYDALLDDVEFKNALRLWRVEVWLQARLAADAERCAVSLLREIEQELARR